jgi:hypothetical protein
VGLAPSSSSGYPQCVDVSNNNGYISTGAYASLRRQGIVCVYAKAAQNGYPDGTYCGNVSRARAVGLLVGAYDFTEPAYSSPAGAAAGFASQLRGCGLFSGLLPAAWDNESFNGWSGSALCSWYHQAENALRSDIPGLNQGVYGSTGNSPECSPNGTHAWPADWLVSFPASLPGFGGAYYLWQWYGPQYGSAYLSGMDRDKGTPSMFALEYHHAAPPPKPSRAQLKRALRVANARRTELRQQIAQLRHLILIHQCARGDHRHATPHIPGERHRCDVWLIHGRRAHAQGTVVNAQIHRLEAELR